MNHEVYYIPTNFTDAGRVLGLFELRNLVEAVILTLPVLYLCIVYLPFSLTPKIITSEGLRRRRRHLPGQHTGVAAH